MATQIYSNSKKLGYSANTSTGYTYTFALKITRDTQNIDSNYTPVTATCSLTSPQSRWDTSNSYGQLSVTLYWLQNDGTYASKTINGEQIHQSAYNTTYSVSISQNVVHLDNGTSKVYAIGRWTSSASNSYRPSSTSMTSSTIALPTISREANFTLHDISNVYRNAIEVSWATDVATNSLQYSLNNGEWVTPTITSNGTYTITNLLSGTPYSIRTRVKHAQSGLYVTSDRLTTITLKLQTKYKNNGIWQDVDFYLNTQNEYKKSNPFINYEGIWK